jgi:hypothetical protein
VARLNLGEIAREIARLHEFNEVDTLEVQTELMQSKAGAPEFRQLSVLYLWPQRRDESKGRK